MKHFILPVAAVLLCGFSPIAPDPATVESTLRTVPVVVELFSSEGCSSCPAADETMAEMIQEADKHNDPLFILDFHVDYFDRMGWKDSFATPEFTKRQYAYVNAFKLTSAYTPQAVINGRKESSGSDMVKLKRLINAEMKMPCRARIIADAKSAAGNSLQVDYRMAGELNNTLINFAFFEEKVKHDIMKGENAGRTLSHNNVVRLFRQETVTESKGSKVFDAVPPNTNLLVYVQDKTTLEILTSDFVRLKNR